MDLQHHIFLTIILVYVDVVFSDCLVHIAWTEPCLQTLCLRRVMYLWSPTEVCYNKLFQQKFVLC